MRLRNLLRLPYRDERGQALVVFMVVGLVLLSFVAMVSDAGLAYWNRRLLQNAVDGAALAGAAYLPNDTLKAEDEARKYAAKHGLAPTEVSVSFSNTYGDFPPYAVPVAITVTAQRQFDVGLRYVVGAGPATIRTDATAVIAPAAPSNIWPIGLDARTDCISECNIKVKHGDTGNFGFVDLDGEHNGGADDVREHLEHSYGDDEDEIIPPPVSVDPPTWNFEIFTETGSMNSTRDSFVTLFGWDDGQLCDRGQTSCASHYGPPPDDGLDYNPSDAHGQVCYKTVECPRVGIVPVLDLPDKNGDGVSEWPNGDSEEVTVIGFTCVYVIEFGPKNDFWVRARDVGQCFSHLGGGGFFGGDIDQAGQLKVFLWE